MIWGWSTKKEELLLKCSCNKTFKEIFHMTLYQSYNNFMTNLIHKHILETTSNISTNSYDDVFHDINVIQNFDSILTKISLYPLKPILKNLIIIEHKYFCSETILTAFWKFTFIESKLDTSLV